MPYVETSLRSETTAYEMTLGNYDPIYQRPVLTTVLQLPSYSYDKQV